MAADAVAAAVKAVVLQRSLTATESAAAFGEIMRGEASAVQISALLVGLRVKGETAEEVAGAAQALRTAMMHVTVDQPHTLVDTCGTGGGVIPTFNISTAAAFVAVGAGVRVAKHGNRSFTSRCGSADVLEALGVNIEMPHDRLARVLADAGMVFMFAPAMHPAMRHVGPVRKELGVPTVMNMLGPLANPAGAGRQLVGVSDRVRLPLIAGALQQLGSTHAMVVYGEPGLDELSPSGPSTVMELKKGELNEWVLDPATLGLGGTNPTDLAGGTPEQNAALIEEILAGKGMPGARNAVLLNAAAAIYVGGKAERFADAVGLARTSLERGAARDALDRLRKATA